MARSIFEARQLITHGHISVHANSGPAAPVGPVGPSAPAAAGAGQIVPVGALISSSADVSLSAYLSRAHSYKAPAAGAQRGGSARGALLSVRCERASSGGARRPHVCGILIKPTPQQFV